MQGMVHPDEVGCEILLRRLSGASLEEEEEVRSRKEIESNLFGWGGNTPPVLQSLAFEVALDIRDLLQEIATRDLSTNAVRAARRLDPIDQDKFQTMNKIREAHGFGRIPGSPAAIKGAYEGIPSLENVRMGDHYLDENGDRWQVVGAFHVPSVTLQNMRTGRNQSGGVGCRLFSKFARLVKRDAE